MVLIPSKQLEGEVPTVSSSSNFETRRGSSSDKGGVLKKNMPSKASGGGTSTILRGAGIIFGLGVVVLLLMVAMVHQPSGISGSDGSGGGGGSNIPILPVSKPRLRQQEQSPVTESIASPINRLPSIESSRDELPLVDLPSNSLYRLTGTNILGEPLLFSSLYSYRLQIPFV